MDFSKAEPLASLRPLLGLGTAVILCAAKKRQFGDTIEAYHQNMAIVENVASLLADQPVGRLLFMSSGAVYGEETHNLAIAEDTRANPVSFYGIAKFIGECLLRKMLANTPTGIVYLRPAIIYGRGDKAGTYGPVGFCDAIRKSQPITLWGDGTELRDFVYIDDLCQIVQVLLNHPFVGPVNIVSGERHSFADIIEILRSLNLHPEVRTRPRTKQKADNAFIPDLIKSLLPENFHFTSLTDGITQMIQEPL
jgi:UDP-glucose 4-epimerase